MSFLCELCSISDNTKQIREAYTVVPGNELGCRVIDEVKLTGIVSVASTRKSIVYIITDDSYHKYCAVLHKQSFRFSARVYSGEHAQV